MVSEIFISTALLLTSASLVLSPLIFRLATNFSYKKKIKKAIKEFEKEANKKLKEIEQKKAELENELKKYNERFNAVHQIFFEIKHSVIDNPNVIINKAERDSIEKYLKKLGDMIRD